MRGWLTIVDITAVLVNVARDLAQVCISGARLRTAVGDTVTPVRCGAQARSGLNVASDRRTLGEHVGNTVLLHSG